MQYRVVKFFYYCEIQGMFRCKEVVLWADIQVNNHSSV
jgi:hypothetical protein